MTNNRRKYNQQKQTQAPYTLVSTLDSETDTEMTEMPKLSDKDITTLLKIYSICSRRRKPEHDEKNLKI